ncbi:MAG: glutathione peroxidase [Bacteroidales bacterium]
MKRFTLLVSIIMVAATAMFGQDSFYDFKVKTIDGKDFDLASLKGKKVMVVNTASKCGFTPQYEELQEIWEEFGGDDFVIIGFPANNFMNQEPGSNEQIAKFCTENYGVSFPMMAKISVKGDDMHPLYRWLTTAKLNGLEDSEVSWNFQKYLVDADGKLVKVIKPRVKPGSEEIISWIKE